MVIGLSHELVSSFEGGDGFGQKIVTLYEMGECLVDAMIASKNPFDVFGVSVCMVEELVGVTVRIFRFSQATGMGVSCIEGIVVTSTGVVSGEV